MNISSRILATVAYSDIFDYPLTEREIERWIVRDRVRVREELRKLVEKKILEIKNDYFFLNGREKICDTRVEREKWSKEKWKIARNTAQKLKVIPFIKMIGVTGALAMENCKEEDDIDLLIITSANCLWLTRLIAMLLSPVLGIKRRKPNSENVKDKICFNLFLEENHLKIEPENLFLAHEICQVKPIFDKGGIYEKFLQENRWVSSFLPNTTINSNLKSQNSKPNLKTQNLFSLILKGFNEFAYRLQFEYMKSKMTCEKVGLHQAFFHPNNLGGKVQKEFERRIGSFEEKNRT